MAYSITVESFEGLSPEWTDLASRVETSSPFVLPVWQQVWWNHFGAEYDLYLLAVRHDQSLIGVAPLVRKSDTAYLIGHADICDYLDFLILPGHEAGFFEVLLDKLREDGITSLDLHAVRPDSSIMTAVSEMAEGKELRFESQKADVSFELDLPKRWEKYLRMLTSKQRHEVKRRIRRLEDAGEMRYRVIAKPAEIQAHIEVFFDFFRRSHEGKQGFLTPQMEDFFRSMAHAMADAGLLRFGILQLDAVPIAMVMCFDYKGTIYLYNSGYNPEFRHLSVGLLSKLLYIKYSIRQGKKRYDFLKGAEVYKHRLGGNEIPIYNCRMALQ